MVARAAAIRGWRRRTASARTAVLLTCVAAAALAGPAVAAEFREVTAAAGILYDGPSEQARKLYLVPHGTPLEVVSPVGAWMKVRDFSGDVLWIERAALGETRHVVASTLAAVRSAPAVSASLRVQVERGVLLAIIDREAPAGWLHVRHRDGVTGFVQADEVWGW